MSEWKWKVKVKHLFLKQSKINMCIIKRKWKRCIKRVYRKNRNSWHLFCFLFITFFIPPPSFSAHLMMLAMPMHSWCYIFFLPSYTCWTCSFHFHLIIHMHRFMDMCFTYSFHLHFNMWFTPLLHTCVCQDLYICFPCFRHEALPYIRYLILCSNP